MPAASDHAGPVASSDAAPTGPPDVRQSGGGDALDRRAEGSAAGGVTQGAEALPAVPRTPRRADTPDRGGVPGVDGSTLPAARDRGCGPATGTHRSAHRSVSRDGRSRGTEHRARRTPVVPDRGPGTAGDAGLAYRRLQPSPTNVAGVFHDRSHGRDPVPDLQRYRRYSGDDHEHRHGGRRQRHHGSGQPGRDGRTGPGTHRSLSPYFRCSYGSAARSGPNDAG